MKKPIMPPVWLALSALAMVAMHYLVPVGRFDSGPLRVAGVVVVAAGMTLILTGARQFDRAKTTIRPFEESSAIVTWGLFRFSRNPIYLGMALVLVGTGLALGSVAPFVMVPVFIWWITTRFIVVEERMLMERFPREYGAYRERTRRWL